MSHSSAAASGTMMLRLSVPAEGGLRIIAGDIATKVAEFLGAEAQSVGAALDDAAARIAPPGSDADIAFEFRRTDGDLLIHARCGDRSSEVRCRLPV